LKLLLAAFTLTGNLAFADAMLRIRPHVIVTPASDVKLSQLVDGQGLSPELMAKMANVSLSVAPAYGEKQELLSANLTSILRPLIQEERARTSVKINLIIPKTVVIDTTKRDLDKDLVQLELLQAWQPLCLDCQLEFEALSLPRIEGIRDWTLRLKSELPRGSFSVPVDLIRENGSATNAWISGRLITKRKVPVAKRILNLGERITAQDFNWEFRDTSYAIDGIPTLEELPGKRLKQGLHAGEPVWRGMLERERAIRAGEMVQLKSSEGPWEVSVSMVAQQDGFVGDVINLKNMKTNNILMGQVTGRGEVELR
jgi:flagella basal body P-ring formation protein FlgA